MQITLLERERWKGHILPMPAKLPEQWQYLKGHTFGDILEAETLATRATLAQKDVPVVHLDMPDESAFSAICPGLMAFMYIDASSSLPYLLRRFSWSNDLSGASLRAESSLTSGSGLPRPASSPSGLSVKKVYSVPGRKW